MKTISKIVVFLCLMGSLTSCGDFGQGMLYGLAALSQGYRRSYSAVPATPKSGVGNNDYLLDPRYAMAQVQQEQAQYNQVFNGLMQTAINQVNAEEEQEYQAFARNCKKPDGSTYSKQEWKMLQAQAIYEMNHGSSSSSSSRSSGSSSTSKQSSSRACIQTHSGDYTHCGGSGKCSRCGGDGLMNGSGGYNTLACTTCGKTGKCPSCRGTGRL